MPQRDSLDKVIGTYFWALAQEPFYYEGKQVTPPVFLTVSPQIFRGFTCPPMCGGCCPRFSLDYLPIERRPPGVHLASRQVHVNKRPYTVYSDMQDDHTNHHCRNLNMQDGRCGIHGRQPFSCDFELIRFFTFKRGGEARMSQQLFGRGWAMLRVDGERGARCEMTPVSRETIKEVERKLMRLDQWMTYFEVPSNLSKVIAWVREGNKTEPLVITNT